MLSNDIASQLTLRFGQAYADASNETIHLLAGHHPFINEVFAQTDAKALGLHVRQGDVIVSDNKAGDHLGQDCTELQNDVLKHQASIAWVSGVLATTSAAYTRALAQMVLDIQLDAAQDAIEQACKMGCQWALDQHLCSNTLNT